MKQGISNLWFHVGLIFAVLLPSSCQSVSCQLYDWFVVFVNGSAVMDLEFSIFRFLCSNSTFAFGAHPIQPKFSAFNGSVQLEIFRKLMYTFGGGPLLLLEQLDRKFGVPFDV